MTADTPSLPAAQECWGLFDASGKLLDIGLNSGVLRAVWGVSPFSAATILPGRFVPDDAKIAEKEAG